MATIVEAVKEVLKDYSEGLTSKEVYDEIIKRNLYSFNAQNPQSIVNGTIRCHCANLSFPTARQGKYFMIVGEKKKKCRYALYDGTVPIEDEDKKNIGIEVERLPEEVIQKNYIEHLTNIKSQLLNAILNVSPKFFEGIVVELLVKMGYGYDENSSQVTQYSRDGGVDGVIEEDKLGLDKIYIQAKRYSISNKVHRSEVDQFTAAMGRMNVKKGVFITTSSFSQNAIQEYSKPFDGKTIRLIDGNELMDYLIKYEIGVKNVKVYKTFILDENYFDTL